MKILFVLKKRELSSGSGISSGLINSANLVKQILDDGNIESKIVEVVDNNCIDKEVSLYKPTVVIIEALWVVPSKFEVLKKLHPNVKWIVRLHSEVPFLANEGVALDWIIQYAQLGVDISANSNRLASYLDLILKEYTSKKVILLPNYYQVKENYTPKRKILNVINVGCFGAIRPLKNQLMQAMAAIAYADKNRKKLYFHINVGRVENSGSNNVLKNIQALFEKNSKHVLVQHGWYDHKDFLNIVKQMDLCLQVSLTETFNIVTADFVSNYVPVVVSHEIKWVNYKFRANPNDMFDIVHKMQLAMINKYGTHQNLQSLKIYNDESKTYWLNYFNNSKTHKSYFLPLLKKVSNYLQSI